jgi:hypothetical protein
VDLQLDQQFDRKVDGRVNQQLDQVGTHHTYTSHFKLLTNIFWYVGAAKVNRNLKSTLSVHTMKISHWLTWRHSTLITKDVVSFHFVMSYFQGVLCGVRTVPKVPSVKIKFIQKGFLRFVRQPLKKDEIFSESFCPTKKTEIKKAMLTTVQLKVVKSERVKSETERPGLPDGFFSNQKPKFGQMLECLRW